MGLFSRLFGGQREESKPFLEHPTGEFDNALAAMEFAVQKLRLLGRSENWITFCAQGQGTASDQYHFAEIRMLDDRLDVGEAILDLDRIHRTARTPASSLVAAGSHYSIASASPKEAARILDAIFRHHLGIRPFADEQGDYAVGAEW